MLQKNKCEDQCRDSIYPRESPRSQYASPHPAVLGLYALSDPVPFASFLLSLIWKTCLSFLSFVQRSLSLESLRAVTSTCPAFSSNPASSFLDRSTTVVPRFSVAEGCNILPFRCAVFLMTRARISHPARSAQPEVPFCGVLSPF